MTSRAPAALITGASRGIGFAAAEALASRGYALALCARGEKGLREAENTLSGRTRVVAGRVDVSLAGEVDVFVRGAVAELGGLDVLVNNAGIVVPASIEETSEEAWDATLDVNLKGMFLTTKAALPHLLKNPSPYVFNIASVAGKKGLAGVSAYCASKFGVVGFTQTLIEEYRARGLRATAICPGYVATDMTKKAPVPPEAMIQPSDIGRTLLYLLDLSPVALVRELVMERTGS